MKLIYNEPKDISLEIELAIKSGSTQTVNGQICKLKKIVLTKEEMVMLKHELTHDWDDKSDIQCYRIDRNTDPYSGGFNYLSWDGYWNYNGGIVEIIEEKSKSDTAKIEN